VDGAPCRTRTCDLLVRSQTLYPTELRAREPSTITKTGRSSRQRGLCGCYTLTVTDRSHYPVRKGTLLDEPRDATLAHLSPAARIAMVWSLTVQAWQFKEPAFHEPRLRRDVVRTLRGGR
jgi:hypothetical protein